MTHHAKDNPEDFKIVKYQYGNTRTTVEYRGDGKWAVNDCGFVLSRTGEWEYEPLPSSRTDDFIARCRFDNLEEAFEACRVAAKKWYFPEELPE
jgi:hypothetical protein